MEVVSGLPWLPPTPFEGRPRCLRAGRCAAQLPGLGNALTGSAAHLLLVWERLSPICFSIRINNTQGPALFLVGLSRLLVFLFFSPSLPSLYEVSESKCLEGR